MATTARPSDKKRHMLPANASSFRTSSREFVRSRGFGPWVSVATSPKGSYRHADVLNFLSTHLPDMTPQSRRWRIIMADDFSAHLAPQVFEMCWSKGYVEITHGGGASMVAQTNDTDHHAHVRKRFIELQTELMIRKARRMGGGMVDLTTEANIDI